MLILRPGELQIRPNGDIFARTDSPERVFDKSRVRFYVILTKVSQVAKDLHVLT